MFAGAGERMTPPPSSSWSVLDLYDNAILSGGTTMFAGVGERVALLSNSLRSALLTSAWFSTAMLSCLAALPCLQMFASV